MSLHGRAEFRFLHQGLERASRGVAVGLGAQNRVHLPPLFSTAAGRSPHAPGVCEGRANSNRGNGCIFGLQDSVGAPYGRVTFAKMP